MKVLILLMLVLFCSASQAKSAMFEFVCGESGDAAKFMALTTDREVIRDFQTTGKFNE